MEKKTKFSNFWENQLYGKAVAYDKIGGKYALSANSTKICLLVYFCKQNSYLRWNHFKILEFSWKMKKKNRKMNFFRFSYFWENPFFALDKIGGNYALPANSIEICLLGYFYMQNWDLRWKQLKFLGFSWKMQKNRKMNNVLRFSMKLLSRISEKVRKYGF